MSNPSTEPLARIRRSLLGLALVTLATGLWDRAAAQCSMCGQAVAQAGTTPEQAFATFTGAVLVLLVPTVLLLGAFGVLLWKHRG